MLNDFKKYSERERPYTTREIGDMLADDFALGLLDEQSTLCAMIADIYACIDDLYKKYAALTGTGGKA